MSTVPDLATMQLLLRQGRQGGPFPPPALPMTPGGKVDRRALPAPDYASAQHAYVAPTTPAEEVLAGLWAELLGLQRVGVHDNFFELGGDSILSIQVVARARQLEEEGIIELGRAGEDEDE